MPIASTNSGNAMMVSAMRPTMRSIQPPKKPAATPASPPIRKTSATEATAMTKSSRVATMTRLKMSRPSWSVPNQCAARRRLQRRVGVARQRIVGHDEGPNSAANRISDEQAEGERR